MAGRASLKWMAGDGRCSQAMLPAPQTVKGTDK